MKKLFILAAAIVAFASCSQNEPEAIVQTREISFAPAATQTRATAVKEYTITDLQDNGFAVWGYVQAQGAATWDALFENTLVTQTGTNKSDFSGTEVSVWQPAENSAIKYWAPKSNYIFSAIYPQGAAKYTFGNDKSQTIADFTIVDGGLETEDLLVSKVANIPLGDVQERVAVGLTFDHMLARVHFQFTNTFDDKNVTIKVRNVQLHGVVDKATATLAEGTVKLADGTEESRLVANWVDAEPTSTTSINFENVETEAKEIIAIAQTKSEATEYRLFIPQNVTEKGTYKLTFDLEVLADNVTVLNKSYVLNPDVNVKNQDAAIELNGFDYKNGNSYLFNANISGDLLKDEIFPIQFDVKVTGWDDDTTVDDDIFAE